MSPSLEGNVLFKGAGSCFLRFFNGLKELDFQEVDAFP